MTRLIKTTILGGILFLVPIVIFVAIIGKALKLSSLIAAPLAERLFVDSAGGFAAVHILAVAILIAICFVAGLAARTTVAKKLVTSLEMNVLDKIPAYETSQGQDAKQAVSRGDRGASLGHHPVRRLVAARFRDRAFGGRQGSRFPARVSRPLVRLDLCGNR